MPDSAQPVVLVLVADLFFAVRIADAIRAAGATPELVDDPAKLWPGIERWPALLLIDLSVAGDWQAVVKRAKLLPQTRSIPIVAFGSHVQTDILQAARRAGCDHAWARSHFVTQLPALLRDVLQPPTRSVEGWDEPPPQGLCAGVVQFNCGEYWACHETLEELWRAESRPVRDLYQGLLQVGIALHHLRAHNYSGTVKMFRRGIPRLEGLPDITQGVLVAEFLRSARAVYGRLVELGPEQMDQFDLLNFPRIELVTVCA